MTRIIQQTVDFEGLTPEELFEVYIDPETHAEAIGAPVTLNAEMGGAFSAFGKDRVRGEILQIVPKRMIVQSWRGMPWKSSDLDSILVLTFSKTLSGARIELIQALVPDDAFEIIDGGWHRMYWEPWQKYLNKR